MKKIYVVLTAEISTFFSANIPVQKEGVVKPKIASDSRLAAVRFPLVIIFSLLGFLTQGQNKVTAISVPAIQTGAVTYGTSSSATYIVTLTTDGGSADGSSDLTLAWSGPTPVGSGFTFAPTSPVTLPANSTTQDIILTITSAANTGAGNYTFTVSGTNDPQTSAPASFIIDQNALTIHADDQNKTYGTTLALGTSAFTATGLMNGETIGALTLSSTGSINTANAGTYAIIPSAATGGTFTASNYNITYTSGNLAVNAAPLTIAANDQNKTYGATLALGTSAFTATGLMNGETIGTLTLSSTGSINTANAGTYAIVPSAATGGTFTASDYTITYTSGNLAVNAAPLTITANDQNKTYGTTLALGTSAFTATGFMNGETMGALTLASTGAINTANAGTYPIVPSAPTGGTFTPANYAIIYIDGTLIVTKAILIVTGDDQTKVYGAANPALTVSYIGFTGTDNAASLTTQPTASTHAITTSPAGTYPITASGGVSNNYTFSYVAGTLTVTRAVLTVTVNNQTKAYGAANPALAVSYIGFTGTDNAASLTTQPTASTPAITTSPAGTYAITASGGVSNNYTFSYVAGTLTVTRAVLTVTANNQTKVYGAANPALTLSYSGFTGTDNAASLTTQPTASTPAITSSPVGTYAITASGGVSNNYTFSYVAGTLTVTKTVLTITASNQTKVYGTVNPALTVSYSGFTGSDNAASLTTQPTVSTTAVTTSPVGTYPVTASGGVSNNYTFTYVAGTLTVTKAVLTVTANNQTKVYGAANPSLTVSYSGFTGSDNAASLTTQPTASTTAITASPAGTYPVTASGGVSNNYTFTYVAGSLTVTKAVLTVTANNQTKVYGTGNPALTISYSGFTGSDNAASLATQPTVSTTAIISSPVGTYPVTASGGVSNNYTFTYVAGNLTVTLAPTTVVVTSSNNPSCLGSAVTFTATVTSNPANVTGQIQFLDGATLLGTVTVSGNIATFSTSALTAVAHSITVKYLGDANYSTSTSAVLTQTINALPTINPVIATPSTICIGNSSNLVVTVPGSLPATIVNYNFNSGGSYGALAPSLATNVTSVVSSGNITFNTSTGTASLGAAFTANATAGNALNDQNPSGSWLFTLGGTALPTYTTYKIYFDAQRASGGDNTVTASFSKDGGASVNIGTVSLNNSGTWVEGSFTLTTAADNPVNNLKITLTVGNGGTGDVKIDNFQVQAVQSTTTFSWTASPAATAGLPGTAGTSLATNDDINVSPTATTIYTVTASNTNGCQKTNNVTVTVNALAVLSSSLTPPARCSNIPGTYNATSATPGTTYSWTRATVAGISNGAGSGNSASITETLINSSANPVNVTYVIALTANGCSNTQNVAVTVNPSPILTSALTQNRCNTISATYTATSATTGIAYTWSRALVAGITNAAGSGAGAAITETLVNTTTNPVNVVYVYTLTANGCSNNQNVTVTVNPVAVLSSATPPARCSNVATTYTATSATTGVSVTWTRAVVTGISNAAGSGSSIAITETLVNTSAAPVNVVYAVTLTINGCSNTQNVTVTVNPKPVAGNITGPNTVCTGSTKTLIPNPTGVAPYTYTWASSNTGAITVNNAGVVTGIGTGTANITYTVTDANGCSSTSANYAVAVTKPTANTITQSTGITVICVAGTVNLTPNATGTGTLTYTWISSNNAIATVSGTGTGIVTGIASGTANITYIVTDGNGCQSTSPAYAITVNPIPTGIFKATETSGLANDDGIICAGAAVTFTAPSGYGSYIFKVNGITAQTGTNPVFSTISLPNNASVTADVANSSNCGTTFGPIIIIVNPLPTPALNADKTTICPGDLVTFTAGGGSGYTFKINGSSVQSGVSATYSSSSLNNGDSVTVDVKNASGCIATSAAVYIIVKPVPTAVLSPSATTICENDPVIFTATNGFDTYEFKVNGTTVQGPAAAKTFNSTTLTNGQVVTVVATNLAGCSPIFTGVLITVNPLPTGIFSALENSGAPNDNSICTGEPVTFTFSTGYSNYDFKVNNVSKQNGTANSYINATLAGSDNVTVEVTSGSGCKATFTAPTITIAASPVGTLSVSPASACEGDDVTFTATANPTFNYNFKINNLTVQNGPSNTYSSTSIANGDVISVDATNSNGCTTTFNTITQIIHALPSGILKPVENSGNTPDDGIICTGANVIFTAPAGFNNYDFLLNGITVQSGPSNTYNNNSLVNGDLVQVAVANSNSCIALLNSITITVNLLPAVAPITTTAPSFNVCVNNTTTLTDATTGGVWASNNPAIATIDAAGLLTGMTAGTVTINYTFTNTDGCSNTVTTIVTVDALPSVAPITGNVNVCTGTSSQFDNITAGGSWGSSNTAVATINSSGLVDGISAGTATISYTVTNGNGCTTIVTVDVIVNDLPSVAVITSTMPSFNVCISSTITLADATPGGTWSSSNTAVATINSAGVVTGITNGTSIISYSITTSCLQIAASSVTITVNSMPSATITYTGGPFCTSSGPIPVVQTGTPGGTYSSAVGLTINASNGTITPATSTGNTYTVTYTVPATGGCGVFTTTTPVTITTAPSASISYSGGIFCTNSAAVNVTRTGTPGGVYTSTPGLTIDGTTGTINPATSTNGTYTITYTIAASGGCAQFFTPASVTITTAPSATIAYAGGPLCTSSAPVNVTMTGATGGTYSVTPAGLTINTSTGTITTATSAGGAYIVTYTITPSGGCAGFTTTTPVTITPAPAAVAGTTVLTCANSGAVNITAGSGATNQSSILWTSGGTAGTITNANSLTSATYTPSVADNAAGSITLTLTANGNGNCAAATSSKTVTINATPVAPTVTPSTATICQGSIQPLSSGTLASAYTLTLSSVTNNVAIPDNDPAGAVSTIAVSGIPAGAVINSISVKFNITHPFDGDLRINLKAPNNKVLNLVNTEGGGGQNFVNTIISSTGITSVIGAAAPFSSTYKAGAANSIDGATSIPGNLSNSASFASMFGASNGNWIFSARDVGLGDSGRINDWALTINYTTLAAPQPVIWSPATDLYTDAGATIPYAGQSLATVYSKPATPGAKIYTATTTNAATCASSTNVTLTVNPAPVVTITADYCAVAGKVRLTVASTPAGATYIWSTGQTGPVIDVDIANTYYVVASIGTGCSTTASISVAEELVTNGDFTNGNNGFTSDYTYYPNITGNSELIPDTGTDGYAVGTDGQNYHPNFWGKDHTNNSTGNKNYMLVNGHGNTLVIWKETVNVLPNTTYYFSAWAMSLNASGPYAQLRFNVNGTLVGTTAVLAAGVTNNSNNGWMRFYGTWTSGPSTTLANIQINDLQNSAPGNDFGLDDVSFGTLSTFITLESAPATDEQTPCVNTPITPIVYSVGSTASGPIITGLPAGVTSSFNGELFTISGTPTVAGNYAYTVTTTGSCIPVSATGTINIQGQKITLTSGSAAPVCINTSLPNVVYTLSGTATGATTSGLPAGVTGAVTSGNTFTLSGVPTVMGTFNYMVATTGTCRPDTARGTITVQSQMITLYSGSNTQTVCVNSAISNIQYTVGGTGTGASVTGLPPGVNGIYTSGFFIISGTPASAAGSPYTYTITTTGPCSGVTATGTLTITPSASFTLTAPGTNTQTVCNNTPLTTITYTVNNATGASVTSGTLPPGVTGSFNSGVFTISGTPATGGIFSYSITTSGGCTPGTATGTITVQAQTIGLTSGIASPSLCANTPMTDIIYTIGGAAASATVTGLPTGITSLLAGNILTISGTPAGTSGSYPYTITTSGTCGQVTATGTINLLPAPVGGTLTSTLICSGSSGAITLSGQLGNIKRWEISTDGGVTWVAIANILITQSYNNITVPTMYRAVVSSSGCNMVYSTIATLGIHNMWTGATSTNWSTASNWSGNALPSMACPDVYIPNTPNKPILASGTGTINNLHIFAGAILTVNGSGTLQIAGTISSSGIFDAGNGAIEFNGASSQNIAAGIFQGNAINDLVITNTAGVTLGGALDVYRSLTYGKTGAILNTGGFLTLKSSATETAWIGNMTGHTITGDVTVERYIGSGTTHAKSWQFLAIPTTGQNINQSWQEGAITPNGNLKPGFGTQITGAGGIAAGFDLYTATPSMKTYNSLTNGYDPTSGTLIPIYNQKGYFVFVRGDRSITAFNQGANSTILRTSGTLFTPANPPPVTPVAPGKFESVGNPYASALDMRKIDLSGGVDSFFIVWDPRLGGTYNYGAFQYFSKSGADYTVTPGGGSYGTPGSIHNFIQSGQGFLVQATTNPGTVSFTESAKANGSALFSRPGSAPKVQMLRTGLYILNTDGSTAIIDGVLNNFDDSYSNEIDGQDARKSSNTSENLSIRTAGKLLVIERRHTITQKDTIFLNLTGERVQSYQFQFTADNLSTGIEGFLEDSYLGTRTAINLSGSTVVNFNIVNIAGSYAPDRFRVVFAPLAAAVVLPVTFTSVKAYRRDKNIAVEWKVDNEMNIKQYEVEKSTNGIQFTGLVVTPATANGGHSAIYVIADVNPVEGYNYYRVKSVDINGKAAYTSVVKVLVGSLKQAITIYPNPITDGMIHLQLTNQPEGKYGIRLLNNAGQLIVSRQINHTEGSSTELIKWDYNLAHGMYQLEVTKPGNSKININVMY